MSVINLCIDSVENDMLVRRSVGPERIASGHRVCILHYSGSFATNDYVDIAQYEDLRDRCVLASPWD